MKELFDYIKNLDFKGLFTETTSNSVIQFFRYVFVGGIAFIVDGGSLFFIEKTGINYLIAAVFAFVIGLICNYILSKLLVFKKSKVDGRVEFIVYGVIGVIGLLFTEIIMYILTDIVGIYFMLSKVVAAIIVLLWNFLARKIILYRR